MSEKIVGRVIRVTQKDIDKGCVADGGNCPVARALKRVFHTYKVGVYGSEIGIRNRVFRVPTVARKFINAFDSGTVVHPFSFKMGKEWVSV